MNFITKEEKTILFELGFNPDCFVHYEYDFTTHKDVPVLSRDIGKGNNKAPTHEQTFKWFREEHGLESFVYYDDCYGFYGCKIYGNDERDNIHEQLKDFKTHEEASAACIMKLIEMLHKK